MTNEEILNGNKLLAEFMGAKFDNHDNQHQKHWLFPNSLNWYHNTVPGYIFKHNLKYHSDWNWLMSVVDKIEDLRYKDIEDNEIQWFVVIGEGADCRIYHDYSDVDEIVVYGAESKIVAAWQAIVEFVRSYLKEENESSTN